MCFSTCLDSLGNTVLDKDPESSMGLAFKKFAIVTKELSNLMKTLMQNFQNSLLIPVDILLKNDLNGVKHVIKRPFEKACKDYETKYQKIEKEKKHQAKEVGLIRSEVTSAEIADEIEKERKIFQLQMCEVSVKYFLNPELAHLSRHKYIKSDLSRKFLLETANVLLFECLNLLK